MRIVSFPKVFAICIQRFVFDEWVPKKVKVTIDFPEEVNVEFLRSPGIQEGENELGNSFSFRILRSLR